MIIDVTKPPYYVRPGPSFAEANSIALQKIIDDVRALQLKKNTDAKGFELYFPASLQSYQIAKPLLCDVPYLSISGDGKFQSVLQASTGHDILIFGVPRRSFDPNADPKDTKLEVTHENWQPSSLDETTKGRFCFKTLRSSYLYFQGTPFDQGQGDHTSWASVDQLTIDFAVELDKSVFSTWHEPKDGFRLFGLGGPDSQKHLSTFCCSIMPSGARMRFQFVTADSVHREIQFDLPKKELALLRASIQLDLKSGEILAFVNGISVDVSLLKMGLGWPKKDTPTTFRANDFREMQIGTCTFEAAIGENNIAPVSIQGFRLTGALLYAKVDAGGEQSWRSGAVPGTWTLQDRFKYFDAVPGTFTVLLPLLEAETTYRFITWHGAMSGGGILSGKGLILHRTWNIPEASTIAGNSVKNIGLQHSGDMPFGRQICYGPIYDFEVLASRFVGGSQNIGAMNGAVGYPVTVRECGLEYASDTAIYAQGNGWWWGEALTIKYYGRTAVRTQKSYMHLSKVFLTDSKFGSDKRPITEVVFAFQNGFGALLEDVHPNFESVGPRKAYVTCDLPLGLERGPTLKLRNFLGGALSPGTRLVMLEGRRRVKSAHYPSGRAVLDFVIGQGVVPASDRIWIEDKKMWSVLDLDSLP
jgi:hypothetical protein